MCLKMMGYADAAAPSALMTTASSCEGNSKYSFSRGRSCRLRVRLSSEDSIGAASVSATKSAPHRRCSRATLLPIKGRMLGMIWM